MDLEYQRKLAAKVAGVGLSRVRINPEKIEVISEAVTRDDIKRLIRSGAIEILQKRGVSRARARGRRKRRGPGSRKGGKYSKLPRKERWIRKIRALRKELKRMRDEGMIDTKTYRELYKRLSTFNSVSQLRAHVTRG
ncbi:MAG: 50S ribosomal protein L19e [Candidatus Korarchaeum sp.]|nr:50S ribosomal protein L19e [Candidatus Korarchaeum sp.]MDW8035445.1 50S ribosomal protein L19e [Candidatus Korarchaeum sp.]